MTSSSFNSVAPFTRTQLPLSFDESLPFIHYLKDAIEDVKRILSSDRSPQLASPDQEHSYDDKFTLSEYLTNVAFTSMCNAFDDMGDFQIPRLSLACQNNKKSVTLRFVANEKCELVAEEVRAVENPMGYTEETSVETTKDGKGGGEVSRKSTSSTTSTTTTTRKVVLNVKHYHWTVTIDYEAYVFVGNESDVNAETSSSIFKGTISQNIVKRGSKESPARSAKIKPIDISLNELLTHMNQETSNVEYAIDRSLDSCRTPKHNNDTQAAWKYFGQMNRWCEEVTSFFTTRQRNVYHEQEECEDEISLDTISDDSVFNPVLPLFDILKSDEDEDQQVILPADDVQKLLSEQSRTLIEEVESIKAQFSTSTAIAATTTARRFITATEAVIVLKCKHLASICWHWTRSINLIEDMMSSQLYDAIGKKVTGKDIDEFVRVHNKRLFSDTYAPEDFCYSIRRPNQYPDGLLSIEESGSSSDGNGNAMTFTRRLENNGSNSIPMYIPINSATTVNFKGQIYLHSWMLQRFQRKFEFHLAARARQFSSFLLLIGKVSGPDVFDPEHGIVLQNKDEVLIPLMLDELPSAKEFKDAIKSLSPEQQRFAQSFRSMKLSSSVVGVCVIQLKPQLELLLGLPDRALTKEVQLTQDLMELFIEYQIPSDLLSYEGVSDVAVSEKVEVVRSQVQSVKSMIDSAKEKELENAKKEAQMAKQREALLMHPTRGFSFECEEEERFEEEEEDLCFSGFLSFDSTPVPTVPMKVSAAVPMSSERARTRSNVSKRGRGGKVQSRSTAGAPRSLASGQPTSGNNAPNTGKATQINNNFGQQTTTSTNLDNVPDFTMIPKALDKKFEEFAKNEKYAGTLRSVVIKVGEQWQKKSQPNLLSPIQNSDMRSEEQKMEKNRAFDLLDALSRSGSLDIACAELHVIVASSHSFDKAVVNTVVQDNINPIEKIERSHLLVASMIHGVACRELVRDENDYDRIAQSSPLFITEG